MDSDALLAFVPRVDSVEIWGSPDLDEYEPDLVATVADGLDFRRLVEFLVDLDDYMWLSDVLDEARVVGVKGLWAEMLLLAWIHDDKLRASEVARALLSLNDRDLKLFRKRFGPLKSRKLVDRISKILRETDEMGLAEMPFAELLRRASPEDPINLEALEAKLPTWEEEAELRDEREQEERSQKLVPFSEAISMAMSRWETKHPFMGGGTWMGHGARRGAVHHYLTEWVLNHGELPSGVHDLGKTSLGTTVGLVDFDELCEKV